MAKNPFDIPLFRLGRVIVSLKPVLIDGIGVEALKFIDDNFRLQGFQDRAFIPWPKQAQPNKPRPHKILILSAALRRSFVKKDGIDNTTISSDIPYASIHNEGGTIHHPARASVVNFNNKVKTIDFEIHGRYATRFSTSRSAKFAQRVNIAEHTTTMPQRRFIGPSPVLTANCEGFIIKKITQELKNYNS